MNRTYEQRRHEPLASPANTYRTRTYRSDLLGRLDKWREEPLTIGDLASLKTAVDPTVNPVTPTDGEDWSLDKVGNWSSHSTGFSQNPPTDTFIPNDLNQYTQVTTGGVVKPFTFDWLGQLVQDSSKGTDGQTYKWDLFGRLTRVAHASNDAEIASYRYDAFNRRVQRTSSNFPDLTTRFVYDGWRSIEERAVIGSGEQVRARYGFGNSLDEVVWMDRASQGSSNPPIDKRYFFAQDGIGSVTVATDDRVGTGVPLVVRERYAYGAYGERSVWTGAAWGSGGYTASPGNASVIGMPFAFTGQRYDSESGLHYYKDRFLDAKIGRFLRRDFLGYGEGPNLYQYADSGPQLRIDPLGLASDEYRREHSIPGASTQRRMNSAVTDISAQFHGIGDYAEDLARRRVDGSDMTDKEKRDLQLLMEEGQVSNLAVMLVKKITKRWQWSTEEPMPDGVHYVTHSMDVPEYEFIRMDEPDEKPPPETGYDPEKWKWDPNRNYDPNNPRSRPGRWVPRGPGGPNISWDPHGDRHGEPHYDVNDGKGNRTRVTPDGRILPDPTTQRMLITAGAVAGGVIVYEAVKWTAAVALAPPTGGGSLIFAAATP